MTGVLLPACSTLFSLLLCIIYFIKKKINLVENKLYSAMIISSFMDSLLVTLLQGMAVNGISTGEIDYISIINKLDFLFLIIFTNSLFIYTFIISRAKIKENIKILLIPCIIIDLVIALLIFVSKVNIITLNGNFSVAGLAVNFTYILCGFYIIASILMALLNVTKNDKRYIPMFATFGLIIFLFVLFKINPYLIVISITLTYVDFIMFHTIENPDLKLLKEINEAKEKAEKYSNEKAIFLFNISQRIKTPVNDIKKLSSDILDEKDPLKINEMVNTIAVSAEKLSYILNDSLDISTMDIKNIKLVEGKYDLVTIVQEACLRLKEHIGTKNIKLSVNYSADIPKYLNGDAIKMKQILNTLLFNAVDYTSEGFVNLNINTVIKQDICRLMIEVEDSGMGLNADQIDHIFDNTKPADEVNLSNRVSLSGIKKIINIIGGTITVESEQKRGTKFTVIVDQKIIELNREPLNQVLKDYNTTMAIKKQILVCTEDEKAAQNFTLLFNPQHYEIFIVKDAAEALNLLKVNPDIRIIFLAEVFHDQDGERVFNQLKQNPGFKTPVVMVCNSYKEEILNHHYDVGINAILLKPIRQKDLDEILERFLSK